MEGSYTDNMTRGYPDYMPGIARTKEGLLLPTIAEPPVWFEDCFNNPLMSWGDEYGTADIYVGRTLDSSSSWVNSGEGCLLITSTSGGRGGVRKNLNGLRNTEVIGVAMHFRFLEALTDFATGESKHYLVYFALDTGSERFDARITYDPNDGKIYLYDENGAFVNIATNAITSGYYCYIKLVFDLANRKYVRLYFNDQVYDLSSYPIRVISTDPGSLAFVIVRVWGATGKTVQFAVDDYKITYGEV